MTWWKQAAKHWLSPAAVLVVVGGCGGETPQATVLPPVSEQPAELTVPAAPPASPIGLIPLPSVEEVQQAAPGGRADPFGPFVGADAQDPTSDLILTGVVLVGDQQRAMVTTPSGSGVICVGSDGRCGEDAPVLLPPGWSVLRIDVARGCIQMALNGEPQEFCMA